MGDFNDLSPELQQVLGVTFMRHLFAQAPPPAPPPEPEEGTPADAPSSAEPDERIQ